MKSIFSDEPEKKLKLTGNKAFEIHQLLDSTYEQFLTDSELTQKIFSDAQSKSLSFYSHKRFKMSELDVKEEEP